MLLLLSVLSFMGCMHFPAGYQPNLSASFKPWNNNLKPDTLWVKEIFLVAYTRNGKKRIDEIVNSTDKIEDQIYASLSNYSEHIEIVLESKVEFIQIDEEVFCPMVLNKDSCSYLENLKKYVLRDGRHENDKAYLIPSYFLKSNWFKINEAGGGAGTIVDTGERKHYRFIQLEVPVFKNKKLIYADSNYYLDSLIIGESEVQEKLFQIDQVIFDSLMYYSFDDKVEPLKLP